MTLENYLAEAGALAGLAGVLAGFALAAVVEFLTGGKEGRLTTAAIVIFGASSAMFLYTLIVAVLSFSAATKLSSVPTELDSLNGGAFIILLVAVYLFIGGIGLDGWMRSRIAGILTTVFAGISMCLITYAVSTVISVFM